MNGREVWFSILQAAVLAPWLWREASQEKNAYFAIGLRLVGTAIFVANLPPIIAQAQTIADDYKAAKAQAGNGFVPPNQVFRDPNMPFAGESEILDAARILPGAIQG